MRSIVESYSLNHAKDSQENIEKLLEETGNKKMLTKKVKRMFMQYATMGTVSDASTDNEASEVLSELLANREEILSSANIKLPMKLQIKRGALVLLGVVAITTIIGMIAFDRVDYFDVPGKLRELHSFCSWGDGRYIVGAGLTGTAFFAITKALKSASKWKEKLLDSFVVDYERQHDFFLENDDKTKIKTINDSFIRFIMTDIEYIKSSHLENCDEILRAYEVLANEYISIRREELNSGEPVDMFAFLSKLTELEIGVYSKNTKKGLTRRDIADLKSILFEERLPYLDLVAGETVNDRYLKFVCEQAERIFAYPYEGCEVELVELYRIAMDYVKESTSEEEGLKHYTPSGKLLARETQIELSINQKIDTCQKYEKLADDIEKMEALLESRKMRQAIAEQKGENMEPQKTNLLKPLEGQSQTSTGGN